MPVLDAFIFLLLAVAVTAGLFGGYTGFFIFHHRETKNSNTFRGQLCLGMAAGMAAPLVLNALSSDILTQARTDQLQLLVYAGFCVAAGIASGALLKSQRPSTGGSYDENAGECVENLTDEATTAGENVKLEDIDSELLEKAGISSTDYAVMSNLTDESKSDCEITALMRMSGLSEKIFNETLPVLIVKGYIGQKINEAQELRFCLTPKGRRIMAKLKES
ncbi:MAG: hypothetical protein JW884_11645 [Deltaproteobacteria bacterium]|nr:hypothetical protein [Deltaproteobacteria bacterium]